MLSDASQMPSNNTTSRTPRPARNAVYRAVAVLIAVIAAGIWLWEEKLEEHIVPKRWGTVEEGKIYRSGQLSATLVRKMLKKHNIAVIVALTSEIPGDKYQEAEKRAAAELGIELLRYPLRGDGTGDINNYARAIAAIVDARKRGKAVLVHCAAGAQRTGGVIACYRMLVEKRTPSFAYNELLRYDWHDKPDQVLLRYINGNMGELAARLKQMGVIEQIPDPLPVIRSKHQKVNASATAKPTYVVARDFADTGRYLSLAINAPADTTGLDNMFFNVDNRSSHRIVCFQLLCTWIQDQYLKDPKRTASL